MTSMGISNRQSFLSLQSSSEVIPTRKQLAAEAGISQKALSKIENDEVEPRVSTLRKLADALEVDARELLED